MLSYSTAYELRKLDACSVKEKFCNEINTHLYASFNLSNAKINNFVSCLYDNGGKGIGENLRLSNQ